MTNRYVFFSVFLFFFLSINVTAQKDFSTQSVSIFKNSTAFFVKSGEVTSEQRQYLMTKEIPAALFGTLWFHSPNNELRHILSYKDEVKEVKELQANSFLELLEANKGKKIKISLAENEILEGVVEAIEKTPNPTPNAINTLPALMSSIVTFKTNDQWISFKIEELKRIYFTEKPNHFYEKEDRINKPVIELNFSSNTSTQRLHMMYLQGGISWSPNYLIELKGETKARLTLRAELTNNAEDLENTEINFVVGVPNFKYATRLSSLVDFLSGTNTYVGQMGQQNTFSNAITSQSISYGVDGVDLNQGGESNVTGSSQEDLFFYNLKNISLKKGGRGHFEIFKTDIEIAHIYESNIQQNSASRNAYQKDFFFTPDNKNKVFHSIKIQNNGNSPWTTGSALVIKKDGEAKPISQDLLQYTPVKGQTYVKLTEAPDVKIKHGEREIKREDKVLRNPNNNNRHFDLVTVEGKLKIRNFKDKKIDLNVRRVITGDLLKSSTKWLKAERINRNSNLNKITDVCWETSLKAGEEVEITYTYKVYIPD